MLQQTSSYLQMFPEMPLVSWQLPKPPVPSAPLQSINGLIVNKHDKKHDETSWFTVVNTILNAHWYACPGFMVMSKPKVNTREVAKKSSWG